MKYTILIRPSRLVMLCAAVAILSGAVSVGPAAAENSTAPAGPYQIPQFPQNRSLQDQIYGPRNADPYGGRGHTFQQQPQQQPVAPAQIYNNGAPQSQGAAWLTYEGREGFSLRYPQGWNVRPDGSGRITVQGRDGETALIWPVMIRRPLDERGAASVLGTLATQAVPDVQWGRMRMVDRSFLHVSGRGRTTAASSSFRWASGQQGTIGIFFMARAPEALYPQRQETFTTIFGSFVTAKAAASGQQGPAAPPMRSVRWSDPRENAFSIEVPQGWITQGGLERKSAIDTRAWVKAKSPDGQVLVFSGDPEIPPFTIPNQMMEWTGFREGSWYSPDGGLNRWIVSRYMNGADFAQSYAGRLGCPQVRITQRRNRPDQAQAMNEMNARYGLPSRLDVGEVMFSCAANGQPTNGYVAAGTTMTAIPGTEGGMWHVTILVGFLAAQGREAEAQAALKRMIESTEVNPAWAQAQLKTTARVSEITRETNEHISNIITQTYESRQATLDEVYRKYDNSIRGQEDVSDPQTGQTYKVESGSNYYWVDAFGTVLGTNIYENPNTMVYHEATRLD